MARTDSRRHDTHVTHRIAIGVGDFASDDRSRLHVQEHLICAPGAYVYAPRTCWYKTGMFNLYQVRPRFNAFNREMTVGVANGGVRFSLAPSSKYLNARFFNW